MIVSSITSVYVCETIVFSRAMAWRKSGRKEPGPSVDLAQPSHGKRTHADSLFGHA